MTKRLAILGSTGSIGTQALEVVRAHANEFVVEVLTAGSNVDLLISQALEFQPNAVVVADDSKYLKVKESLSKTDIKVFAGQDAIEQIVTMDSIDIVLMAIVGFAALRPTLNALEHGKTLAIANKETFVVAGEIMVKKALENKSNILPVDSEHSAIYQCLVGEMYNPIEKIYLTASGGPFRDKNLDFLKTVKAADALKHPNWQMGAKITVDSASLMNKGFEMIEAKWLFNLQSHQIDVLVHPQSIIHSMVQFSDGSIKAQLGLPDMKLPIQYALTWPHRSTNNFPRMDFGLFTNLSFEKPNTDIFRNLLLAQQAMIKGGNMPCIVNAANEVVVDWFLKDKIGFLEMSDLIEKAMEMVSFIEHPTLENYFETDKITREKITERIK
jgi:1-deoxy-D-xylulose-5-phosphate reductoisomerase